MKNKAIINSNERKNIWELTNNYNKNQVSTRYIVKTLNYG